jgi:hypothetical protein
VEDRFLDFFFPIKPTPFSRDDQADRAAAFSVTA